jgi:hypothetical protein
VVDIIPPQLSWWISAEEILEMVRELDRKDVPVSTVQNLHMQLCRKLIEEVTPRPPH